MKKLIPFLLAITLAACGSSSSFTTKDSEGTECDKAGEESPCSTDECSGIQTCNEDKFWGECICNTGTGGSETGDGDGDGDGDTGGNPDNTGGSDSGTGGSNQNTGGTSAGGNETGTGGDSSGGMGGDTGGTNSGGADSGTGGMGGSCIPKTCEDMTIELNGDTTVAQGDIGTACGFFDDGCGGELECNCINAQGDCGMGVPINSENQIPQSTEGQPNICGGGCILITPYTLTLSACGTDLGEEGPQLYSCSAQYLEVGNDTSLASEIIGKNCTVSVDYASGVLQGFCCE